MNNDSFQIAKLIEKTSESKQRQNVMVYVSPDGNVVSSSIVTAQAGRTIANSRAAGRAAGADREIRLWIEDYPGTKLRQITNLNGGDSVAVFGPNTDQPKRVCTVKPGKNSVITAASSGDLYAVIRNI